MRASRLRPLNAKKTLSMTPTTPQMNLDLAPIGWAFGLALVAAAFQIGTRMQKDTEALV